MGSTKRFYNCLFMTSYSIRTLLLTTFVTNILNNKRTLFYASCFLARHFSKYHISFSFLFSRCPTKGLIGNVKLQNMPYCTNSLLRRSTKHPKYNPKTEIATKKYTLCLVVIELRFHWTVLMTSNLSKYKFC